MKTDIRKISNVLFVCCLLMLQCQHYEMQDCKATVLATVSFLSGADYTAPPFSQLTRQFILRIFYCDNRSKYLRMSTLILSFLNKQ